MASPRVKRLPVGQLVVDTRVQRDHLDNAKLIEIRDNYDRNALGTLQISERPDGAYVILDGWHRQTVVDAVEGPDYLVSCQVFTGLTIEDEARLFIHFNRQRAASKLDKFRVRVTLAEPVAVAIQKVATDHGWDIGASAGRISAVDTMEAIYKLGEHHSENWGVTLLSDTLYVITQAWGREDKKAVDKNILSAVGHFLLYVQEWLDDNPKRAFDHGRLAANIVTYLKKGPGAWLASCRGIADGSTRTLSQCLISELGITYNKGQGGQKLPREVYDR